MCTNKEPLSTIAKRYAVPVRRLTQDTQLDLFEGPLLYVSQADAATALGLKSTRLIQYWESQGLLHPELPAEGRNRRYTRRDLVEMRFIHELLEKQGYSVPALKEKLKKLQAPYDYDPAEVFWDPKLERWTTREDIAAARLQELRPELDATTQQALEKLADQRRAASVLLDMVRDALEGRTVPKKASKRGSRRA